MKKWLIWGGIAYGLYWLWKQRGSEGLGQYPRPASMARPRWGYRKNIMDWEQGIVPPGTPWIAPRGGGYREGTRQFYQVR